MDLIAFIPRLVSAILSIFGYILNSQLTKKQRWAFLILIIVSLLFSGISLQQQHIRDMESSASGTISSNEKNIIYPSCIKLGTLTTVGGPEGFAPMGLGGNGFFLIGRRSANETNPIQNNEDKIIVWIENGQLKVSTVVRDKDGKILASVVGNDFFTMPRPAILDRNYDENNLEVEDVYGNIILQVSMVGQCARVLGVFYDKVGNDIVLDDAGFHYNPGPYNAKINPIFVHPCEGHLGERVKK
jgi:hypothetical protein